MTDDVNPALVRAEQVLRRHWGHATFRPGQGEVVADVLSGRDVLGILPTGAGKSVCYQVPPLLEDGLTLVVSPLVALMADQVAGLQARGIEATWLGSDLSYGQSERRWDNLLAGRYRLLYVAPERLSSERFRARSGRLGVVRIAVDEAHCVSEWGHDFRPDFLRIPEARAAMGGPQLVAVTATATPPVRRDIVRLLDLRDPVVHVHGFDRPNIVWSVFEDPDKLGRLTDVLRTVPGGGIVYVSTRRGVDRWTERLREQGESVRAYHAGLPTPERRQAQESWTRGDTRVMVATSAFGMGIDRPDVRFVVHVEPSSSLEGYYQEAGRAGRDGKPAHGVLLVDQRDRKDRLARIAAEHPDIRTVRRVYDVACSMADIAVGSDRIVPFRIDEERVAGIVECPRGSVRRAIELLERSGLWARVHLPASTGLLRILVSADKMAARDPLAEAILRTVPADAWSDPWPLHVDAFARRAGMTTEAASRGLSSLAERQIIEWLPPAGASLWSLQGSRQGRPDVDPAAIRKSRKRAQKRFRDQLAYVDAVGCKRRFLLAYFGESSSERCGRCDWCTGRHEPYVAVPSDEEHLAGLLRAVEGERSPDSDVGSPGIPGWRRKAMIAWLVQEGYLDHDPIGGGRFSLTRRGRKYLDGSPSDQGSRSSASRSTTVP